MANSSLSLLGSTLGIFCYVLTGMHPAIAKEPAAQEEQWVDPSTLPPVQAGTPDDAPPLPKQDNRPGTIEDVKPLPGHQIAVQNLILSAWDQSKSRNHCPPAGFLRTRLNADGTLYPS